MISSSFAFSLEMIFCPTCQLWKFTRLLGNSLLDMVNIKYKCVLSFCYLFGSILSGGY